MKVVVQVKRSSKNRYGPTWLRETPRFQLGTYHVTLTKEVGAFVGTAPSSSENNGPSTGRRM